jgi:hypothetical protein
MKPKALWMLEGTSGIPKTEVAMPFGQASADENTSI